MNDRIYYSHEAEVLAQRRMLGVVLIAVTLGTSLGVALALLFAPRGGEETRREIAQQAEQAYQAGAKTVDHFAGEVERFKDRVTNG